MKTRQTEATKSLTISCIVPTCDRREFLPETLRAILNQTLSPYEIIVVDTGKEPVDLPEDPLGKVKVHRIVPYAGASQSRNFGACLSSGEYLAFCDDDDLWCERYLENVANAVRAGSQCVVSRLDKLEDGQVLPHKNAHGRLTLQNLLIRNPGVTGSNVVLARSLFFLVGGYDPRLETSEDKSLVIDVLRLGAKIITLPNNQVIMRMHKGPRLSSVTRMAEGTHSFVRKYRNVMGLGDYVLNWCKILYLRYRSGNKWALGPLVALYLLSLPKRIISRQRS